MNNDTPISDSTQDKLGFASLAIHLARALEQNDLSGGLVIGIEGSWGSGKSSLVNLALEILKKNPDGPHVVSFAPWLIGNRNELLQQLFNELAPTISDLMPESERDKIRRLLNDYGRTASHLASLADLAELAGAPYAGFAGRLFRCISKREPALSDRSLSSISADLRARLTRLNHPIAVFIDDLDRLEPNEAVEVLRLVRAVADFPNVAYILAYDTEALAANLKRAIGISDGKAYLEKVVQVSFRIPMPLGFDLKNWLQEEVQKLLPFSPAVENMDTRLSQALNYWCQEYVSTPRHVVRILNALRLYVVPQAKDLDLADAVFLQIVRIRNPTLYNWIEEYVLGLSAVGDWGVIPAGVPESMGKRLLDVTGEDKKARERTIFALSEHLPGFNVASLLDDQGTFQVYSQLPDADRQRYAPDRRLASPRHFRLYFSFSFPDGVLSDDEVTAFIDMCVSREEDAIVEFQRLSKVERPQGGKVGEVLLGRIVERKEKLAVEQIEKIFGVLGSSIDELARHHVTSTGWAEFLIGDKNEVFGLLELLERERRLQTLTSLFRNGTSIAWLSAIIRHSTIEQGHFNFTAKPTEDWILSAEEYECIRTLFLERIRMTEAEVLKSTPYFIHLMYAWYQGGDAEEAKRWVKEQSSTDAGFMDLLSRMTSWSRSSSVGVRYLISTETLNTFYSSVEGVKQRLLEISTDSNHAKEVQQTAYELIEKIRN